MQWNIRFFFLVSVLFLSVKSTYAQNKVIEPANRLLALKKYSEAEVLLAKAYNQNQTKLVKELLADTYAFQAKWDQALLLYKELQQDFPKNAEYHFKYGGALGRKALDTYWRN